MLVTPIEGVERGIEDWMGILSWWCRLSVIISAVAK